MEAMNTLGNVLNLKSSIFRKYNAEKHAEISVAGGDFTFVPGFTCIIPSST